MLLQTNNKKKSKRKIGRTRQPPSDDVAMGEGERGEMTPPYTKRWPSETKGDREQGEGSEEYGEKKKKKTAKGRED